MPERWGPRPYQQHALRKVLANPAHGLFLSPGMGKTSIMLAAARVFVESDRRHKVLVIAPLRVVHGVWQQEARKWFDFMGLRIVKVHGTPKQRTEVLAEDADIYVINPENLVWLTQTGWTKADILVVDESTKFKSSQSKRFKALRPWLANFDRRYILTGTPAPNGYEQLFSQIYILDGGAALGKYITHFRMKYMVKSFDGFSWEFRPGAKERIRERIAHLVTWMDPADHLQLPELNMVRVPVQLPKAARATYDEMERDFIIMVEEELVTALTAGSVSGKLRQLANGCVYDSTAQRGEHNVHDAKIDALRDLRDELGSEPLLVAYEYRCDAARIQEEFRCPLVGGGISAEKAQRLIDQWNAGELPMLLIHPASGGHGLNLQSGGCHLAWYGLPWDLELYDQMIARIWRQGQDRRVTVHHIMAEDTIDDRVFSVLQRKDREQKDLLQAFRD